MKVGDLVCLNGYGMHWGINGLLSEIRNEGQDNAEWIFLASSPHHGTKFYNLSTKQVFDRGIYVKLLQEAKS